MKSQNKNARVRAVSLGANTEVAQFRQLKLQRFRPPRSARVLKQAQRLVNVLSKFLLSLLDNSELVQQTAPHKRPLARHQWEKTKDRQIIL